MLSKKKKLDNLNSKPIPLECGIDIPDNFDPGYTVQEICDCGNDKWQPGYINMGSIFGHDIGKKRVNLCTKCGNAQLLISNEYLKKKK